MPPDQLRRHDLATMSSDEINEARAAGRLDDLLAGQEPERRDAVPLDVLAAMSKEGVEELIRAHREESASPPVDSIDQGARGSRSKGQQLSRKHLAGMSADEISKALAEGSFDRVLGREP